MSDVQQMKADEVIYDVVIIGAGPAGMTAGMYAARAGLTCVMVEELSEGGQLAQTEHLENYPGFNQSTSGYELASVMFSQAEAFGASIIYDQVVDVDVESRPMVVKGAEGDILGRSVIVASGARPAKLGIAQEEELTGAGVSYCATCDGNFFRDKDVCVVGGGDTAVADAIYLSRICKNVFMIVRRDVLRAAAIYHERLAHIPNVHILWNTVVESLIEENGAVAGVRVRDRIEDETKELRCSALFIAVGIVPNTEFLNGKLELDQTGHIVTDDLGKTTTPGVFAAGDVRTKLLRQVTTAVADGANAVECATEYLALEAGG